MFFTIKPKTKIIHLSEECTELARKEIESKMKELCKDTDTYHFGIVAMVVYGPSSKSEELKKALHQFIEERKLEEE